MLVRYWYDLILTLYELNSFRKSLNFGYLQTLLLNGIGDSETPIVFFLERLLHQRIISPSITVFIELSPRTFWVYLDIQE